jgi:hypothetical protein
LKNLVAFLEKSKKSAAMKVPLISNHIKSSDLFFIVTKVVMMKRAAIKIRIQFLPFLTSEIIQ